MSDTPEHDKRMDAWKRNENNDIPTAYAYVDSILHTADGGGYYTWHGWALREAFLAGISHAEGKQRLKNGH